MSTIQQTDKWDQLARIFECVDEHGIELMKKKLKVKEVCIRGFSKSLMNKPFYMLLRDLGFKNTDFASDCVINGCPFDTEITSNMINHLIGYHGIPIRNIGKLLPIMRARAGASKNKSIKNTLQTIHMRSD